MSTVTSFVGLLGMGWCVWVYLEYVSDFIQRCMSVYIQGVCVLHSMCVFGLWVIQLGWVRLCFIQLGLGILEMCCVARVFWVGVVCWVGE